MSLFVTILFLAILIVIFVEDLRFMRVLDRVTIPSMFIALVANFFLGAIPLWSLLAGGLVIGGFFFLQFAVSKGAWIGDGDIRLGVLMGLMLGLPQGLVALFLAYVFGAVVSIILLSIGKAHRKTQLPFGTFLCFASAITLFYGQDLLNWYLGFFL